MHEHQKPRLLLSSPNFFLYFTKEGEYYDKWMGLWRHGYKLLDYLAIKVGDSWLNSSNFLSFEKINSRKLILRYNNAEVIYELSRYGLKIIIKSKFEIHAEVAINIRKKSENYHLRTYDIDFNDLREAYVIKDEANRSIILGGIDIKESYYKDHYPFPFEKQRCYVLKCKANHIIYVSDSIDNFDKLISQAHQEDIEKYYQMLNNLTKKLSFNAISSKKDFADEVRGAWFWAIDSLLSLKKQDYYVAGLPWFDEFWARDALWAGFALLALDLKDDLRSMLIFLGNRINKQGHMLTLLNPDNTSSYHGDDILPLYLILAKYYLLKYPDKEVETLIKDVLKQAESYLKHHVFNGVVIHRSTGTWMDTISKEWVALDIQALWTKAAKCWKHQHKKMRIFYEILLKGLIRFYKDGKWYRFLDPYSYEVTIRDTANMFLLTLFDLVHGSYKYAVLERGKQLLNENGIALENPENLTFDARGYHKGAVWLLVNGWALTSYLQNGYEKESFVLLRSFIKDVKRYAYGNFSEVISWDRGELLGASHQLWSASMFIVSLTFGMQSILLSDTFTLAYPSVLEKIAKQYSSVLTEHCIEGDEIRIKCFVPCTCENCYIHGEELIFKREVELYDLKRGD